MENEVFYVCYGSNLHENRFREYLTDDWYYSYRSTLSTHEQKMWDDIMAESAAAPLESYRVNLNHDVYFAGHSGRWGGGIAYLDVDSLSQTKVYRAYKISTDKFESLFSQENGYYSGKFDWGRILTTRETRTDAGFYGRIVNLGTIDGTVALTFTHNLSLDVMKQYQGEYKYGIKKLTPPGQPYKDVIAKGLRETRKLAFKPITPLV